MSKCLECLCDDCDNAPSCDNCSQCTVCTMECVGFKPPGFRSRSRLPGLNSTKSILSLVAMMLVTTPLKVIYLPTLILGS